MKAARVILEALKRQAARLPPPILHLMALLAFTLGLVAIAAALAHAIRRTERAARLGQVHPVVEVDNVDAERGDAGEQMSNVAANMQPHAGPEPVHGGDQLLLERQDERFIGPF